MTSLVAFLAVDKEAAVEAVPEVFVAVISVSN